MTDEATGCAIAVMAKAPRPGRVKTRLMPFLQPDEAAQMSAAFLRDITANIALALERDDIGPAVRDYLRTADRG